ADRDDDPPDEGDLESTIRRPLGWVSPQVRSGAEQGHQGVDDVDHAASSVDIVAPIGRAAIRVEEGRRRAGVRLGSGDVDPTDDPAAGAPAWLSPGQRRG